MRKNQKPTPPDPKDALRRLADLTRKIVRVPKSEIPTETRKSPELGPT
jgi:hypothetical protein